MTYAMMLKLTNKKQQSQQASQEHTANMQPALANPE
jgi:hypothetical protein